MHFGDYCDAPKYYIMHSGNTGIWCIIRELLYGTPLGKYNMMHHWELLYAALLELPYVVCASIDRTTLLSILRYTHHVALTKLLLPSCLYRDTISKCFFGSVNAYLALLCQPTNLLCSGEMHAQIIFL